MENEFTINLNESNLFTGIINIDGDLWKDQRRFLHERLRAFGMKQAGAGKEQLEARIMVN